MVGTDFIFQEVPVPVDFLVELSSSMVQQNTGIQLSERYYLDPLHRLQEDLQQLQPRGRAL